MLSLVPGRLTSSRIRYVSFLDTTSPSRLIFSFFTHSGLSLSTSSVSSAFRRFRQGALSLLAVSLEAGSHEIELHYETPWLRAGCAISAVSACLLVAALIVGRRKHKGVQP